MENNFDQFIDLYNWNKTVFTILGVWPLKSAYILFTIWIIFFTIQLITEFADLYYVFGNLELTITNLSETTLECMIMVKLMVLRFSKTLAGLMNRIMSDVDSRHFAIEEKKIYLHYNRIAKSFFRLWTTMGVVASIMYHVKPLEFRLKAVLSNESMPYVLPYRSHLFFDVTESSTFWLIWILQCPLIYVHAFHSVTIGFLFSLVLHVCGKLSVLAFRIKNLDIDDSQLDIEKSRTIIREIVKMHLDIIRTARDIDGVFHLILLEELLVTTVILGLTSYSVIMNSSFVDKAVFISFLLYGFTMLLLVYGYCVAGEYLIVESTSVYEAYYQCQWYDAPNSLKKQLITCMIGARKPLHLTGGGFYIFSLASFTRILKTTASGISMLRKVAPT